MRGGCKRRCWRISRGSGHEPDEGIWEVRGARRHFTHSKLMAWVAFDRAIKAVESFGLSGPVERMARAPRADPRGHLREGLRSPSKNSFVQYYGGDGVDAALLLIPQVGFLPPEDPRVHGTVAAIERELMVGRPGAALSHRRERRRPAAGRRRLPRLQLLAGRRLRHARPPTTTPSGCSSICCRCATTSACSPRSTTRAPAAARQFPAGLLARRPGQHRQQPDLAARPGRAARRARCVLMLPRD